MDALARSIDAAVSDHCSDGSIQGGNRPASDLEITTNREKIMKLHNVILFASAVMSARAAQAEGFVNGGFEQGSAAGWTVGGGYRGNASNPLPTSSFLPGGTQYDASIASSHSRVISSGTTDPSVGAALGSTVYSGQYSWRVEDTRDGGYASVLQQRVDSYTDQNIFFAWKAVLENGGHIARESATMVITLRDLTTNTEIIRRDYNAGASGTGIDNRFKQSGNFFYTSDWQIEQLAIDQSLSGHNFLLTILGADCEPTGHAGYVYLDGFGAVTPPTIEPSAVPEPATWGMMTLGFGAMGLAMRRRRADTRIQSA